MSDSNSSDLLNFLSEPRSLKEVAEHFGISPSVADYYLQKAIEQNQVLVCKCSSNAGLKSRKKQKQRETLFYISQNIDPLSKGLTGFAATRVARTQGVGSETTFVKFSSTRISKSNISSMIENALDSKKYEPRQTSFPRIRVRREKLVRSARRHAPVIRQPLIQSRVKSLSAAEKLSMFAALSRQLLSYSDLHVRFNISKQTIKTSMKNGLIEDVWGPKNIGVRFRLTKKGEKHLKRLKVAAKLEKDEIKKATIRLKHGCL